MSNSQVELKNVKLRTWSLEDLVRVPMKFQYISIHHSEHILEVWVVLESFLKSIKSRKGFRDFSIGAHYHVKNMAVTACNLLAHEKTPYIWIGDHCTWSKDLIGAFILTG